MATKKASKTPASEPTLASAALTEGGDPVRPGFAFTPEHDRYFALGYPHLRFLAEGLPEDADPVKSARAILDNYHGITRLVWPAETAHRLVRAWGTRTFDGSGKITPDAIAALQVAGPPSADEVRQIIAGQMGRFGGHFRDWQMENYVFLLEAMVGPRVALEAFVAALESYPQDQWVRTDRSDRQMVAFFLGFLLLRLPVAERAEWTARLTALHGKGMELGADAWLTRMLDLVLHGAQGAKRSVYRYGANKDIPSLEQFLLVTDDAAAVRAAIDLDRDGDSEGLSLSARHVWLGGPEVLDIFLRRWPAIVKKPEPLRFLIETVGQIRDERTVLLVADLWAKSKARKAAQEWLTAHADFARPVAAKITEPYAAELVKVLAAR